MPLSRKTLTLKIGEEMTIKNADEKITKTFERLHK